MPETKPLRGVEAMLARAGPILARIADLPAPFVVEIGTFAGLLAEHLLRQRADLILHTIDSWLPTHEQPAAYRATGDSHAHRTKQEQDDVAVLAMNRLRPFGDRVRIHRAVARTKAHDFPDGTADLVLDDSDHSYEGVTTMLAAWWRVVKPGGWYGWHDYGNDSNPKYHFEGVKAAVDLFAKRLDLKVETDGGYTAFVRKP